MNKSTIAAWTLAAVVITTGSVTAFAREHETSKEEKVAYHSSIQVPAGHGSLAEWRKLAKISKADAVLAAKRAVAGKVMETKLENEAQNLVYTVEIRSGGRTSEVIVDAGTGKVLASGAEQ